MHDYRIAAEHEAPVRLDPPEVIEHEDLQTADDIEAELRRCRAELMGDAS